MNALFLTIRQLIVRPIAVNWNLLRGVIAFRLGRFPEARGFFRRILDLDIDHFPARVYLGRIHFHFLEIPEGLAHLSYARRLDPARFQRARLEEYFQGYDLDWGRSHEKKETPLFANFRSEPDAAAFGHKESWEFDAFTSSPSGPPDGLIDDVEDRHGRWSRQLGDFSGPQEYGRFKDLPPITRDEIEEIDWNDVTSEVFD